MLFATKFDTKYHINTFDTFVCFRTTVISFFFSFNLDNTADFSVHEICQEYSSKEIYLDDGRPFGVKYIKDQFLLFIKKLVGEHVWGEIEKEFTADELVTMFSCLEYPIQNTKPSSTNTVSLKLPVVFRDFCTRLVGVESFEEIIRKNHTSRDVLHVQINGDKLRLNATLFISFFEKTIKEIVDQVENILFTIENITVIFMVGDFSECKIVQDAIRRHFRNVAVIVPDCATHAVLQGAVYYGHIHDAGFKMAFKDSLGWVKSRKGNHFKQVNSATF